MSVRENDDVGCQLDHATGEQLEKRPPSRGAMCNDGSRLQAAKSSS